MIRDFGKDYGVKPRLSLVADFEFADNFKKANCTGLMYGFCPDKSDKNIPHELAFMMEHEEFAEKFLDSLVAWKENSKGNSNAVSLEFVELNDGDYMLAIGPDMQLFRKRVTPEHLIDRIDPIMFVASQAKGGMKIGVNYRTFKDNYQKGRRISVRYYLVKDNVPVKKSERYFIKDEFQFYTEDNIPNQANGHFLVKGKDPKFKPERPPKPSADSAEIEERRVDELKYFFPITYKWLGHPDWAGLIGSINKSYSHSQIAQAVCNLILLERLKINNPNNIDVNKPSLDLAIIEHLLIVYESFESHLPDISYFTKQKIEKQIRSDAKYLKQYLSK